MKKFMQSIDNVISFIIGDKRDGNDRRVKLSKRRRTRRIEQRRLG